MPASPVPSNMTQPSPIVASSTPRSWGTCMARSIDRAYEGRKRAQPVVLVADVRAGLANGSLVRGTTPRVASGMGVTPVQGDILPPARVASVTPPLGQRQEAIAWEVIERPTSDETGWRAMVVGIRVVRLLADGPPVED